MRAAGVERLSSGVGCWAGAVEVVFGYGHEAGDEEADGGDGFLAFFGFHEVVVEVGVEFFGDSEGGGQEGVVVFVGQSSDGDSHGGV